MGVSTSVIVRPCGCRVVPRAHDTVAGGYPDAPKDTVGTIPRHIDHVLHRPRGQSKTRPHTGGILIRQGAVNAAQCGPPGRFHGRTAALRAAVARGPSVQRASLPMSAMAVAPTPPPGVPFLRACRGMRSRRSDRHHGAGRGCSVACRAVWCTVGLGRGAQQSLAREACS